MRSYVVMIILLIVGISIEAKPLRAPDYDPFKKTQKILNKKIKTYTTKRQAKRYTLYAIYDNKVNINKKFYTIGDRIGACTLYKIFEDNVMLKCHTKIKTMRFLAKRTYKRVER